MAPNNLTAFDALAALMPLIGAGGITSIVIAIISYMKAMREGRRGDPEKAGLGITALLSDSGSIDKLALSMDRGALALDKIALITIEERQEIREAVIRLYKLGNDLVDEVRELRRAVQDRN
jgi:hypothetical protein